MAHGAPVDLLVPGRPEGRERARVIGADPRPDRRQSEPPGYLLDLGKQKGAVARSRVRDKDRDLPPRAP